MDDRFSIILGKFVAMNSVRGLSVFVWSDIFQESGKAMRPGHWIYL